MKAREVGLVAALPRSFEARRRLLIAPSVVDARVASWPRGQAPDSEAMWHPRSFRGDDAVIDHVVLNVSSVDASRTFYAKALAPLGYSLLTELPGGLGFGRDGKVDLWIGRRDPVHVNVHVAFVAAGSGEVDAFHAAALEAKGRDNGRPGPRPDYGPTYYGAFVLDPDGNNIEAVCHVQ